MLKNTFLYDQNSVRLLVEGLPDTSLGQSEDAVGIISSWKLELIGKADLEGKREHLEAMMIQVLPYARYLISGVKRPFGDQQSTVSISSEGNQHKLTLRSSRQGVEPMAVFIDDAELTDLVRCLDQLRYDSRVPISWNLTSDNPLKRNEIVNRVPIAQRIFAPLIGGTTFFLVASIATFFSLQTTVEFKDNDTNSGKIHLSN